MLGCGRKNCSFVPKIIVKYPLANIGFFGQPLHSQLRKPAASQTSIPALLINLGPKKRDDCGPGCG